MCTLYFRFASKISALKINISSLMWMSRSTTILVTFTCIGRAAYNAWSAYEVWCAGKSPMVTLSGSETYE